MLPLRRNGRAPQFFLNQKKRRADETKQKIQLVCFDNLIMIEINKYTLSNGAAIPVSTGNNLSLAVHNVALGMNKSEKKTLD